MQRLHYDNVHVKVGDGYRGWAEHAPFDKIIVTCSPEQAPPELVAELKDGGRMVIPVGQRYQQTLYLFKKVAGKLVSEALLPTLFVPMTGAAEQRRQVKPDPLHPTLENGDFEQVEGDPPRPVGWHYQRQLQVISDGEAPSGKNYVLFSNDQPGRPAQALQGFAVDGRKVARLTISLKVRGRNIRQGQTPGEVPVLGVTFYSEKREPLGQAILGPWVGTFNWETEKKRIDVPPHAREAILRVGLLQRRGRAFRRRHSVVRGQAVAVPGESELPCIAAMLPGRIGAFLWTARREQSSWHRGRRGAKFFPGSSFAHFAAPASRRWTQSTAAADAPTR